ncbi:MAG: phosphate acyltransferase PlsX [Turneriella sp.]|nr:phosphate acyltransferase PlsX [Turneriella sp.]
MQRWMAVDAMSGDYGPGPVVQGAIQAAQELKANVLLVGEERLLRAELERHGYRGEQIRIVHAGEIITMHEAPAMAVRQKKNASVNVAARLVAEGEAIGFFSPGNTGATMAAALAHMGRLPGVKRPAIATPIPREDGGATVLIDSGANVDCKPDFLVQFAIMGEVYSREIMGVISPKVGIISNGEEDTKGNELTLAALHRLRKLPLDFVGNIEGRDLYGTGKPVHVAVCDGFVGNVVLKAIEGLARTIFSTLKKNINASALAQGGALLMRPAFMAVKNRMDYASYGGAPLLGVNGACIIGHGSSNAKAVRNAIRVGMEFAQKNVTGHIAQNIQRFG